MLDAWRCLLAVGLFSSMGHAEDCPALALVQSRALQMKQWKAAILSAGVPNSPPKYDVDQSMGGFTMTGNTVNFNGKYASVLWDLGQRSGKLYLEYTRTGSREWESYVGVQRTPTKHGVYHDGVSANGNGGEHVRFAVAGDGVDEDGVNSLLIDLDAETVSINGMAPLSIPGQGNLFLGVYDGTSTGSGTVTLNFGQAPFGRGKPEGAHAWCCELPPTTPKYHVENSMGGFTVTGNTVNFNGIYASVLWDLGQSSGKLYLEYTRTGSGPWESYVGVQRTPTKHGVYHDGYGTNGNGAEYVRFAAAGDGVDEDGVNSLLIDLDAGTASINGMPAISIPGQGDLFFGVYDGTSTGSGTVALNFGQDPFRKPMPEGARAWCCDLPTTCPQYDGQQSMGGFEVTDNMVEFNDKYASVLYDLGQRNGKFYLEYTRTGSGPWESYVGVQRTPTKNGVYHDGGGENGNGGDFVRFAVANDGVYENGVNSLLIDTDAETVSINGMAPQSIPGQGDMFFGVYDGTSTGSGTVTLNFGQEPFSKDMPEGASAWCRTPPDASEQVLADFVTLDFRYASLVQNNLGGKGPDIGGPELMEFKNVSKYGGRSLNLEIEALSDYYPADVNKNNLDGAFGQINVLNDKSVDLAFTLRYDDSGETAQVPKFNVSFWDLDNGKKSGGVESVTVGPILAHFTTSQSEFITTQISQSQWKFTATEFGKEDDNPDNLTVLTPEQLNRALEVETSSPTLYVTLNVSMMANNWPPERGRTFMIGGSSNNPAFSEHTLGEMPLKVALQAPSGNYMARCRDCQKTVGTNPDTATVHATSPDLSYAQFMVMKMDGGRIALMSDIGKFAARCEGCIVNGVHADAITFHASDPKQLHAQFLPELQLNGNTALMGDTGKYVSRCEGCSPNSAVPDTVTCHTSAPPLPYATWRVVPLTWPTGTKIALQGSNDRWMSRCNGCQNTVGSNPDSGSVVSASPGDPAAHFTVISVGGGKIALKSDVGKFAARCNQCVVGHAQKDIITFHVDDPIVDYAQFTPILLSNGNYALKSDTGKYVSLCSECSPGATVDQTVTIHADSSLESWAQWNIVVLL